LAARRLDGAKLRGAQLFAYYHSGSNGDADLKDADLTGAKLRGADLTDARITKEQLAACKSLKGAVMSNGQKYEDWLKDQEGRGKDAGNADTS
jgi:uncharacterized protein YjbI with pentapeptide repeats